MPTGAPAPSLASGSEFDPEADVLALSEQTARMVAVAHVLVASHRHVDIAGLQDQVGLLCAKALDLPPSKTGFLKLELKCLASRLDELTTRMRKNAA